MSATSRVIVDLTTGGLIGMATFQLLLAAGAPMGRAAFGGSASVLALKRRIASGVSALVFLVAAFIVLAHAGEFGDAKHFGWVRVGIWVLVALFALSTVANVASRSPWERFLMAPVGLLLTAGCFAVALNL